MFKSTLPNRASGSICWHAYRMLRRIRLILKIGIRLFRFDSQIAGPKINTRAGCVDSSPMFGVGEFRGADGITTGDMFAMMLPYGSSFLPL